MTSRKRKRRGGAPEWETKERVVAAIERAINPSARVRHNVKVPDLSTGHLRQCDVLIEYGTEPRVTRTLVEVQTRNSRVEIGILQSWWAKMQGIGAQHLICVSALPFPQTVRDEVQKKLGPGVYLIRLRDLEKSEFIFKLASGILKIQFRDPQFDQPKGYKLGVPTGERVPSNLLEDPTRPVFRRDDTGDLESLVDLLRAWCEQPSLYSVTEGTQWLEAHLHNLGPIWLCLPEGRIAVLQLTVPVVLRTRWFEVPITLSAYEQVGAPDALAWAVMATGEFEGCLLSIRIIYRPDEDGRPRFKLLDAHSPSHQDLTTKTHPMFAEGDESPFVSFTFGEN